MYFQTNISKQLVRSGRLETYYNTANLFKKYELGFWEIYQDINTITREPVSSPYRVFRTIFSTSNPQKMASKFAKLNNNKSFA